ncbi:hypothetical protein [Brucella anthropi]|uniref:hypothetical protein n=1 Tax=Brucella anthropi TaxID=529 RepID=UPI00130E0F49|nr:hypothetical protein [Brucella anthropi]
MKLLGSPLLAGLLFSFFLLPLSPVQFSVNGQAQSVAAGTKTAFRLRPNLPFFFRLQSLTENHTVWGRSAPAPSAGVNARGLMPNANATSVARYDIDAIRSGLAGTSTVPPLSSMTERVLGSSENAAGTIRNVEITKRGISLEYFRISQCPSGDVCPKLRSEKT